MNPDLPSTAFGGGPAVIRQIQLDIEQLKACLRSMTIVDSQTLQIEQTSLGVRIELLESVGGGSPSLPTWLP
jgi:hypothetical protein